MKNLVSSYTRLACNVYSGEVRGEMGTRSGMCCVGLVVWIHGFWYFCYYWLIYLELWYPASLPLMRTLRLPVVDWTDAPRRFKWARPFRRKTKSGFCARAITFPMASTSEFTIQSSSSWTQHALGGVSQPVTQSSSAGPLLRNTSTDFAFSALH